MPAEMASDETKALLLKLLGGSISARASDLHLRAGSPPFIRIDGHLARTSAPALTAQTIEEVIALTSGRRPAQATSTSWEYSFEQAGVARYRGHAFRDSGGWALSLRLVPPQIPTFQELRLPPVVKALSEHGPGLVLITGPTGSGKSTTAAAMLRYAAAGQALNVITVEDPIEYSLTDVASCISQREVGRDTPSYADALQAAMREDPDLLFVGEIRDAASLEVVLQAAETGHAVISTFHTGSALKTVQRVLAMLPGDDQAGARSRLADALRGIVCQRLLPRKGSRGRVVCCEVLVNNYAIKECIKDPAKLATIPAVLERSSDQQMHTFDKHLVALVRENMISADVAYTYANAPSDVRRLLNLQGVGT